MTSTNFCEEALDLLQLQQRGRAKALRLLDAASEASDPAILAQADAYEECGNELKAAIASLQPPPSARRDATEKEADAAVAWLLKVIEAAEASNQAGENAVVKAALATGWKKP